MGQRNEPKVKETQVMKNINTGHQIQQDSSKEERQPGGISLDAIQVSVVGTMSGSDGMVDSRTSTWQNIHNIKN